jgi:hypothetical protein
MPSQLRYRLKSYNELIISLPHLIKRNVSLNIIVNIGFPLKTAFLYPTPKVLHS